jgi:hypothetical protein
MSGKKSVDYILKKARLDQIPTIMFFAPGDVDNELVGLVFGAGDYLFLNC